MFKGWGLWVFGILIVVKGLGQRISIRNFVHIRKIWLIRKKWLFEKLTIQKFLYSENDCSKNLFEISWFFLFKNFFTRNSDHYPTIFSTINSDNLFYHFSDLIQTNILTMLMTTNFTSWYKEVTRISVAYKKLLSGLKDTQDSFWELW